LRRSDPAPNGVQRQPAALPRPADVNDIAHNRHLFVEDLARRLQAMDAGHRPMNALDYRVHARMLRHALAGLPRRQLKVLMTYESVCEVLDNRGFDENGLLPSAGAEATALRASTDALLQRLQRASRKTA
jgi:hypothetical protein